MKRGKLVGLVKKQEVERMAVYCRVSSAEQERNENIQTQIDSATRYIESHNNDDSLIEIVDWYLDENVSSTLPIDKRPDGGRLVSDAEKSKFDIVLVWKLDRLGRGIIGWEAVDTLSKFGLDIRSITEPFDISTPIGRAMVAILSAFGGLEREVTMERSIESTNRRARDGQWLGGIVPYGYEVVGAKKDARLVVCEKLLPNLSISEAEVVRLIYRRLIEENKSTIKIADELNALGIPPAYVKDKRKVKKERPEGKRKEHTAGIWRPARVGNLIRNPTYKGIHIYGKRAKRERELIERPVPPIVNEDTWQKAQQVLRANLLFSNRNAKEKYLLRGLVKCGLCGLNYVGCCYPKYGGGKKRYYRCNGKTAYRGKYQGKCPSKAINADVLEEAVWNELEKILLDPSLALDKLDGIYLNKEKRQAALDAEISLTRESILDKQGERDAILDLYRRKTISLNDLEKQLAKIATEEATLKARLEELQAKAKKQGQIEQKLGKAEELLNKLQEVLSNPISWEVKREVIELLVLEIKVNTIIEGNKKANEVIITFAFDESMLATNYTHKGS